MDTLMPKKKTPAQNAAAMLAKFQQSKGDDSILNARSSPQRLYLESMLLLATADAAWEKVSSETNPLNASINLEANLALPEFISDGAGAAGKVASALWAASPANLSNPENLLPGGGIYNAVDSWTSGNSRQYSGTNLTGSVPLRSVAYMTLTTMALMQAAAAPAREFGKGVGIGAGIGEDVLSD